MNPHRKILLINGSRAGAHGNTAIVLQLCAQQLSSLGVECTQVTLSTIDDPLALESVVRAADGFLFASGVYWQSWGSPLQRFFEVTTPWEATDIWLGKPAATIITMHSVGGMEVLARLNLNLTMLGLMIPPQSCLVHSHVAQIAGATSTSDDIWDLRSLPTVCKNLVEAVGGTHRYEAWAVDSKGFADLWVTPVSG